MSEEPLGRASPPSEILVVEDDAPMRRVLAKILTESGLAVRAVAGVQDAIAAIDAATPDTVLTDQRLSEDEEGGLDLLAYVREKDPDLPVILITAYGTVRHAVRAMREGAFDYILKPFDHDELIEVIRRTLRYRRLSVENRDLRARIRSMDGTVAIVARSPAMEPVIKLIQQVAPTSASVLLTGESGTGKGLAARTIHSLSQRAEDPFLEVNCGALPESLLESELFGHAKGAYTGADREYAGRFARAEGGTLLLDEIGTVPSSTQIKLLRVLQEREFEPLGSEEVLKADVRIVAATNEVLEEAVREGRIREDLYYRLNVVHIHIPPLRNRVEDIPILAHLFLRAIQEREGLGERRLSTQALRLLTDHSWPGNVRELENAIERAYILCEGDAILPKHLPKEIGRNQVFLPDPYQTPLSLRESERRSIVAALAYTRGNKKEASRLLGINRSTLYAKLKALSIPMDTAVYQMPTSEPAVPDST